MERLQASSIEISTLAGVSASSAKWNSRFRPSRLNRGISNSLASLSIRSLSTPQTSGPAFELAEAASPAWLKGEGDLREIKIKPDGRCMFRALALGLADLKGQYLGPSQEVKEADTLRVAVAECLCRTPAQRAAFPDAVQALKLEDSLPRYCQRILDTKFWGGEVELLVLSKLLKRRIKVYVPQAGSQAPREIQTYGRQFEKTVNGEERRPVRLLYNGKNHYDLLVAQ